MQKQVMTQQYLLLCDSRGEYKCHLFSSNAATECEKIRGMPAGIDELYQITHTRKDTLSFLWALQCCE